MNDIDDIQENAAGDQAATLKRPLEEDNFDGEVPSKKSDLIEEALETNSTMSNDENCKEVYQVPEKSVGSVIGKAGCEIRAIQAASGCRVQMDPDSMAKDGFRACNIEGTPAAIAAAKSLILSAINRNHETTHIMITGDIIEEMMAIPSDKCGLVIGKGGETIRNLQEQSGLRSMAVVQDTTEVTGQSKPLKMIGTKQQIELAKQLVQAVISQQQGMNKPMGGGGYHHHQMMHQTHGLANDMQAKGEVIVPRLSAGMIIGKGGEMIKRLAMETGTKIQFKPDEDANSPDRVAVIIGTRDQIYMATEKITEIVNKAIKNNGPSNGGGIGGGGGAMVMGQDKNVFFMHVPTNKCGLVIGKAGENIRQIERDSGAYCALSKIDEHTKNPDEKVFEIRGTPYQIHHASHLVRIKVGEVPPNTMVPPMPGATHATPIAFFGGGGGGGGGGYQAYQQQAQQPQQQPQFVANAPMQHQGMWQGGQQPQMITSTPAGFQQTLGGQQVTIGGAPIDGQQGGQPTVNPLTGAPDYSAQWAQYYRSIGLNDQAAMVENQMKRSLAAAPNGGGDQMMMAQQQHQFYAGNQ